MPTTTSFTWYQYQDGLVTINMAPPLNIGGKSLAFTVTKEVGGLTNLLTKTCASGYGGPQAVSGIAIVNSGQGVVNVSLAAPDFSGWNEGAYPFKLQITDSGVQNPPTIGYLDLQTP